MRRTTKNVGRKLLLGKVLWVVSLSRKSRRFSFQKMMKKEGNSQIRNKSSSK